MKNYRDSDEKAVHVIVKKIDSPILHYRGILLWEDSQGCEVEIDIEGNQATMYCYYDEWIVKKIY